MPIVTLTSRLRKLVPNQSADGSLDYLPSNTSLQIQVTR